LGTDQHPIADVSARLPGIRGGRAVGRTHRLLADRGMVVDAYTIPDHGIGMDYDVVPDLATLPDLNPLSDNAICAHRCFFGNTCRGIDRYLMRSSHGTGALNELTGFVA
jgi:hypothetical protein